MSTFILGGVPGSNLETITFGTGGALQTAGNALELQINQSATLVTEGASTRGLQKSEAIILLDIFMQYIVRMNWPYASS